MTQPKYRQKYWIGVKPYNINNAADNDKLFEKAKNRRSEDESVGEFCDKPARLHLKIRLRLKWKKWKTIAQSLKQCFLTNQDQYDCVTVYYTVVLMMKKVYSTIFV